jgi:type II secretory pathway predicted ATPase ExeA
MADKTGYERYGLTGNPFRDLSSETLDVIDIFHVNQPVDDVLDQMRSEIIEKENKAVVVLLAELGAGKTERLLMIQEEARRKDNFCVMRSVTRETKWVAKGVADSILEELKKSKKKKMVQPRWISKIKKISRTAHKDYDPELAGKAIAEALNSSAPSFLLLNDIHGLETGQDTPAFLNTLHALFDSIEPGVMIVMTSDMEYYNGLVAQDKSLAARVNRILVIPPLSDKEASLMIAKRLLAKRVVKEMNPFYPFTESSIAEINQMARGNPREVLKMADQVMEQAMRRKTIQIDEDLVQAVLELSIVPSSAVYTV